MMPRHAPGYAVAMLMAFTVTAHSQAEAQVPPSQYDRLQRTLEEKFSPPKRPRPPITGSSKSDDFIYVEPDDKTKKSNTSGQKRSDASDATWAQSLYSFFSRRLGSEPEAADTAEVQVAAAEPAEDSADSEIDSKTQEVRERARKRRAERHRHRRKYHRRPERGSGDRRRQRVPVAKPNSYVIQLAPDADADAIDALLGKYGFTVTKMIAPLGVLTVELDASGVQREAARAAPEAELQDPKTKLQNILEPPLIKELREETIVDAAFVNSVMEARHLPGPGGASINVDNEVFSWRWNAGDGEDGNWGLKQIRVPPVWTMLKRHRAANPDAARPKVGIIDGGFGTDPSVSFASMQNVRPLASHTPGCGTHHGMHVAGIIGAKQVDRPGIDGIVPAARIDAIAIDDAIVGDSGVVGVDEGWQVHALLFDDVLAQTLDYVYADMLEPDNLRVINISLGYNFVASNLLGDTHPQDVPGLGLHVMHQANLIRLMASRVQDRVLFVVAAGNDSDDDNDPIEAKWASPFAWAATQPSAAGDNPSNILVVEAVDRDGFRADFSNVGGHVSAPGVDIMSTLDATRMPFAVCSGTSQAAPHAAAVAAILFELAPEKSPAEIAELLASTGTPALEDEENAPTIDAFDAVVAAAPEKARLIADLDNDGVVGPNDLALFARQLEAVATAATANTAFGEDLNGDGVIDDNECFWPKIDLNGSGHGALTSRDARKVGGVDLTDLAVIERFWSDPSIPFGTAVAASGLATPAEIYTVAEIDPAPITTCRRSVGADLTVADASKTTPAPATPGTGTSTALAATKASGATGEVSDAKAVRSEVERAVDELKKTHPNLRVTIDPATGLPSSVIGISPLPGTTSIGSGRTGDLTEEEVKRAVDAYFGQGGLGALYPSQNRRVKSEYVGRRKDPDFPDRTVADVEQRIDGVPVFGSSAKLTVSRALGVTKYSGSTSNVAIDNTTPKIAEGEAVAAARTKLAEILRTATDASRAFPLAPDPMKVDVATPDLVVFDPALVGETGATGRTRLAWLVSIDSFRIFVDAETGEAFYSYRDKPSGMLRKIFDLGGNITFPGAVAVDESESRRADTLSPEAQVAFRNAGIVRDYFFIMFGRNGYDDNDGDGPAGGAPLEAYVRHGQTKNAYWCTGVFSGCPGANVMVYGPGYAEALDIVAHEMTHGIIAHEKNLLYLNEPGAVNESIADIFGALIELDFKGEGGNWLIGERTPGFSFASPLRSMAEPNLRDADGRSMFDRTKRFSMSNRGQPDHYGDVLTPKDTMCGSTAYNDNGCVHFNSGILNKFAYLVAEGGTHRGVTVRGIGRYKLARLTYRAMTVGLNRSSTLSHAANAFVDGCFELSSGGVGGFVQADCEQVMAAQRAVGLDAVPST